MREHECGTQDAQGKTLDYGPMNRDYRLWTLDWFSVTHHLSLFLAIVDEVAKWAGAFKAVDEDE
jgi:hypothetical protein